MDERRSFKSLDAYNYFVHGWLHDFDIVNYLVYSQSHYTMDERRSYKSLDAYQ